MLQQQNILSFIYPIYNHNWRNVSTMYVCVYIYIYIQGVPGGLDKIRESVPYVKLYRYNPKHLYPKLNG